MLRAGLAWAEKVPEFNRCHLAAGRQIGLVQNERAAIVVPAEEPPVTIFTVINFPLAIGHLDLRETNQWRPQSIIRQWLCRPVIANLYGDAVREGIRGGLRRSD
jgi:hypothetical protein